MTDDGRPEQTIQRMAGEIRQEPLPDVDWVTLEASLMARAEAQRSVVTRRRRLPWIALAAVVFVLAGASEQLLSIRAVNELLRFTMFRQCNEFLWIYGFFSFTTFGAV